MIEFGCFREYCFSNVENGDVVLLFSVFWVYGKGDRVWGDGNLY